MNTARSLHSDRAYTLLGRYVAIEHAHAARSLRSDRAHAARSLRSDQARTLLGSYVATEHTHRSRRTHCSVATYRTSTHTARSLRSDRAHTLLGRYVATEHAHRLRPVKPEKSPPLGFLLNPHRNAFRFVSIGNSVEILRRKQEGLFLACFHSLRSDLSDRQSLRSDLGTRLGSLSLAIATEMTSSLAIATRQASKGSSFTFSFESSSKLFSFRLNRSFRRKFTTKTSWTRLGSLSLAIATEMTSSLAIATCQASKGSSFTFSFESSSKRFSFRLNRSFRRQFTTKTCWTRLGSLPLAIATEMTSSLAIATCQASKGSSFAFSFEVSVQPFSFVKKKGE
ncbi:hypothetical protein IGI04_030259 [Brassica rapa subsp. trilocularis]|uniref:Uncharacterized protein n=1 Tax=Brassica rapa subsp. trilocularis TaxID=1813537 RepID=A0ABQ7LQ77_BRACM|nr:hypothetical protein IGI04_030259 [Brassica rapa subsp. trilocularis]